jgi:hypothetical protein
MTTAIPAASCPVCVWPHRGELEELLSRGISFAAATLRLGDPQPPVPSRDELAAHVSQGHLLPASERRGGGVAARASVRGPALVGAAQRQ